MKRSAALLLSLACACVGAGGKDGEAPAEGNARARGALVAKVNGASIGIEQVRELAESAGLSPRAALMRLEEEQLLAEEARRRGYGRSSATKEDVKRALVQALLADTVDKLRPEDVPLDEVRARFDVVAKGAHLSADSFPEHEPAVRAQLHLEKQKIALEQLTTELRARIGVTLSEPEVQKVLSDAAYWGES